MACYYPLTAWRTTAGDIVFTERGDIKSELMIPCGRCIGCRIRRSQEWATRCMHESQMHEHSCFVTLTYDDDNLPADYSLHHRHFQLFMKRLRLAQRPARIRFYMSGEYGDEFSRPHYHACLFGVLFTDRTFYKRTFSGDVLYKSKALDDLWRKGDCQIGDVTYESAAYVARYCMKKVTGSRAERHYQIVDPVTGEIHQRVPEYSKMSLKPGIGATWFAKYGMTDVFPHDRVVINGKDVCPPKYYFELLKRSESGQLSDFITHRRTLKSQERAWDNTEARLRVREKVQLARVRNLTRSVE